MIVTKALDLFESPLIERVAAAIPERADLPTFTDDYHNLLRILEVGDDDD